MSEFSLVGFRVEKFELKVMKEKARGRDAEVTEVEQTFHTSNKFHIAAPTPCPPRPCFVISTPFKRASGLIES